MRYTPSLKKLYETADSFLESADRSSLSKEASASKDDKLIKLAEELLSAEGGVEVAPNKVEFDMDKVAEALNIIDAAADIDSIIKAEAFEKRAKEEGYSDEQIADALNKVAAARVKKNLPIMIALGLGGFTGEDKNNMIFEKGRVQKYSKQPQLNNAGTQGY